MDEAATTFVDELVNCSGKNFVNDIIVKDKICRFAFDSMLKCLMGDSSDIQTRYWFRMFWIIYSQAIFCQVKFDLQKMNGSRFIWAQACCQNQASRENHTKVLKMKIFFKDSMIWTTQCQITTDIQSEWFSFRCCRLILAVGLDHFSSIRLTMNE